MMSYLKKYWKTIAAVVLIVAASYLISTYLVQLMLVQGDSMYPTLKNMQPALIDKRVAELRAGDVIVFRSDRLKSMLVKRVVACPGDTVKITNGRLYVNGSESPLYKDKKIEPAGLLASEIKAGKDEYIVLGDNITRSKDSRYEEVGTVQRQDITGKVIM